MPWRCDGYVSCPSPSVGRVGKPKGLVGWGAAPTLDDLHPTRPLTRTPSPSRGGTGDSLKPPSPSSFPRRREPRALKRCALPSLGPHLRGDDEGVGISFPVEAGIHEGKRGRSPPPDPEQSSGSPSPRGGGTGANPTLGRTSIPPLDGEGVGVADGWGGDHRAPAPPPTRYLRLSISNPPLFPDAGGNLEP